MLAASEKTAQAIASDGLGRSMLDFDVQRSRLTCGSKSAASLPAKSDDCGHRLIIDAMPDPVQHAPARLCV